MVVHMQMSNGLPRCEGWLDKFSVGRGFFSTKSWKRRYVVVTREGIGYAHQASKQQLNPAETRCFVPFEGPRGVNKDIRLRPVYFLRRVTPYMHSEILVKDLGTFSSASTMTDGNELHHFFALSFLERGRRLFLLLCAETAEDYHVWTSILSLYVHEGSVNTVVPVPHPLESKNSWPSFILNSGKPFYPKLTHLTKNAFASLYVKDPDPCPASEFAKLCSRVRRWDEGERNRHLKLYEGDRRNISGKLVLTQATNEEERLRLVCAGAGADILHDEASLVDPISASSSDESQ